MTRARYIGTGDPFLVDQVGECGPCRGFDDECSAEYGGYWFAPDGLDLCFYVDPQADLEILPALP